MEIPDTTNISDLPFPHFSHNAGALYDAIGNYDSGFYFSGAMIFISGIMLFALPWMERNRRRKRSAKKCHDGNDVGDDNECQNAAVLEA